jgi:4-hydroxy-2-oxoheptanedioate aldolase
MNGQDFRNALRSGKRVYGAMLVSRSPKYTETIQSLGMDYVFIDTEHIDVDRTTLSWMCRCYRAMNICPVVRITAPDPYQASTVLDGGACGVVAPYIETPEQVRALVGAVKYKPLKGIKLERILNGEETPGATLADYIEKANAHTSVIVNIESVAAIENLDRILAVPGLDGVLIGPHDLSTSLGIPEQYTHPEYEKAVETILVKARKAGVGAGIHVHYVGEIGQEIDWCKKTGANLVCHRSDILSFKIAMQKDLAEIKAAL